MVLRVTIALRAVFPIHDGRKILIKLLNLSLSLNFTLTRWTRSRLTCKSNYAPSRIQLCIHFLILCSQICVARFFASVRGSPFCNLGFSAYQTLSCKVKTCFPANDILLPSPMCFMRHQRLFCAEHKTRYGD